MKSESKIKSPLIKYLFLFFVFISFSALSQKINFMFSGIVADTFGVLPGVTVGIDSLKAYTSSDAEGKFTLFNIPQGSYKLNLMALGYKKIQVQIVVDSIATESFGIHLEFDNSLNEIEVITRERSNQARSINKTKNSLKIVTIKSAEEINKLPAKNAADIAARLPSMAVQRNHGENSIVSLRGTPSDWSAILVNGDRLPVACEDNTTRSFEFEAFPSDLVDEVIEARSITPDMESDNIGGSINFLTRPAPFERVLEMDVAGGYNFMAKKPTGNFKLLFGDVTKNKKLSFIANASYYARNYATDATKIVYGNNTNHSVNRLELRRYDGIRATTGGNICIEYKPTSNLKFGTHGFFGDMTDDKYMKKESFNWIDDDGRRLRLQNAHGILSRRIFGGDIFAEIIATKRLKITGKIAMYDNEFSYGNFPYNQKNDPRNGFLVTEFLSEPINFTDFSIVDKFGNAIDASSPDATYIKLIGTDEPYGLGDNPNNVQPQFTNTISANKMDYSGSYTETNSTKERDALVAQTDADYQINNKLKLQIGGKYRNKIGYRHISKHQWLQDYSLPNNNKAFLLSDIPTTNFTPNPTTFLKEQGANYQSSYYPFLTNEAMVGFIPNNQPLLREVTMDKYNPDYKQWVGSNYSYSENQTSGYAMLTYASKKIATLGGLRIENTVLQEAADTLTNQIGFDSTLNISYQIPKKCYTNKNYTGILPSVNFVYSLRSNSIIHFAASRTMHRPNFEETKPGAALIRYNELKNTIGNPNLRPVFSVNVDAAYDYFWGTKGMFSIGGYYKNITDHVFAVSTANIDVSGLTQKTFQNASNSWVAGIELLLNRKFDFLKGAWSGLGINSNITYSYSRMKVPGRPQTQAMTEQTPLLYGVTLYYEYKKIGTRIALLYNGRYLTELNLTSVNGADLLHKDSDFDTFINEYYSLDYQFSYQFTKRFSAYLEVNNILNAPDRKYIGKTWRIASTEYYRCKGQLGIHFQL